MKRWLLILFVSLAGLSCKKENTEFCKDGFIFWGGDPAADGSGWNFSAHANRSDFFALDNLDNAYKTDSLAVNICLTKTGNIFYCFCAGTHYYYHINSIRLR